MKKPPRKKKLRLNSQPFAEALQSIGGDMLILARIQDWTRDEKILLAAMLPQIREIVRTLPTDELAKLVGGPEVKVTVTGSTKVRK